MTNTTPRNFGAALFCCLFLIAQTACLQSQGFSKNYDDDDKSEGEPSLTTWGVQDDESEAGASEDLYHCSCEKAMAVLKANSLSDTEKYEQLKDIFDNKEQLIAFMVSKSNLALIDAMHKDEEYWHKNDCAALVKEVYNKLHDTISKEGEVMRAYRMRLLKILERPCCQEEFSYEALVYALGDARHGVPLDEEASENIYTMFWTLHENGKMNLDRLIVSIVECFSVKNKSITQLLENHKEYYKEHVTPEVLDSIITSSTSRNDLYSQLYKMVFLKFASLPKVLDAIHRSRFSQSRLNQSVRKMMIRCIFEEKLYQEDISMMERKDSQNILQAIKATYFTEEDVPELLRLKLEEFNA